MRTLLTFGAIGLYLATAFTPPGQGVLQSRMDTAKAAIGGEARTVLIGEGSAALKQIQTAAKLVKAMSKDPKVSVLLEQAGKKVGTSDPVGLLAKSASLLSSVAPTPKKVISKVVSMVVPTLVKPSQEWKQVVANEKDPMLKHLYEEIDWAGHKSDVRLCKEIDPSVASLSSKDGPTIGDLLALCLAKATADASRCEQIDSTTAPELKSICESELVGNA